MGALCCYEAQSKKIDKILYSVSNKYGSHEKNYKKIYLKPYNFESKLTIEQLKEKLVQFYNNVKIVKDDDSNKNNNGDLTFAQLRKYEEEQLTKYFLSKKSDFEEILLNYFARNVSINVPTKILDKLIEKENGDDIYQNRLENEIEKICKNENKFNIKYLTIMLLGKSGVGKSTLINQFLKLKGENRAKTGVGNFQNTVTKVHQSDEVPFLRLVDTRGIELNMDFGAEEVKIEAEKFINAQLETNNMNNFVHCFWYCITGTRFEEAENKLLNDLRSSYADNKIPIIIVYTQATDDDAIEEMRKYIKKKKIQADFIQVLAERKKINNNFVEPFNLDILLKQTLNKCSKALNGEMNSLMAKNISNYLNNLILDENEKIANSVRKKIILDFIDDYNLESDSHFKNYIFDNIFGKNIKYFLNKNNISQESLSFLNKSEINDNFNQCIKFYKGIYSDMINNDLKNFAYDFLDYQAIKEKETSKNILNNNRRTHKDFIETSKKFLGNNFIYISQILYIKYLIDQDYFIKDLLEYLKTMINNIFKKKDIKKLISDCFLKKFQQFEERIKGKKIELLNKAYNNIYEENNNENNDKVDNNNNNENDLPPPEGALDYPEVDQVEEKSQEPNVVKSIDLKQNKIYKPNGEGIIYYDNGNIYKGQLKNNIRFGQGEMIFFNGYTLKGNFNDKAVNGKVVITYKLKKKKQISNFKLVLDVSIPDIDIFDIQSFVNQNIN